MKLWQRFSISPAHSLLPHGSLSSFSALPIHSTQFIQARKLTLPVYITRFLNSALTSGYFFSLFFSPLSPFPSFFFLFLFVYLKLSAAFTYMFGNSCPFGWGREKALRIQVEVLGEMGKGGRYSCFYII